MRSPQLFSGPLPPLGTPIIGPIPGDIWTAKVSGIYKIYVAIGTGTFDSDNNPYVQLVDGTTQFTGPAGPPGPAGPGSTVLLFTLDGSFQVPTSGATPWGNVLVPYDCVITGWILMADQAGSAVMDCQRTSYSDFPNGFSSICGSDKPTLASAQKNENLSVSAWTTALAKGDVLTFILNSVATVTRLNLAIVVSVN